jgi:hypothetical protein
MGASALGARARRRGGIVGINVTPMVDVMLVLLVIMMVAATYIVSRALKVELPKSAASDEQAQSPLTVTLTKDNHVFVNGERRRAHRAIQEGARGPGRAEPGGERRYRGPARSRRPRDRARQAARHREVRSQRGK